MKFCVLMPLYFMDSENLFYEAIKSITINQTIKPDEFVLIQDGPINFDLNLSFLDDINCNLKIIKLPNNLGIVKALNYGLEVVESSHVLRMDADDISLPNRIEITKKYFKDDSLDILAASIIETDFNTYQRSRQPKNFPLNPILLRNPFFHPATAYRKSSILKIGAYRNYIGFEDFDLWIRSYSAGFKMKSINDVVLKYRLSSSTIKRRGGFRYLLREIKFLRAIKQEKLVNLILLTNILIRLIIRLLPESFIIKLYKVKL